MQIRTEPDFLGTTTIPAHKGVGTSTLEITPMASMHSSSLATVSLNGSATLRGEKSEYGAASGLSLMS